MRRHREKRAPTLGYSLGVVAAILGLVLGGNKGLNAPIEAMFFLAWLVVYPACTFLGCTYKEIEEGLLESCKSGFGAVLILLAVGAMTGAWMASGTVPAMISFGLQLIRPRVFLLATFVLCGALSMVCGTSWGTMGTAGVAMFAVGSSLGLPPGMTVGAIVSGSFLGDMLSPMGGTTNVVSAAVGTTVSRHCKELGLITAPAVALSALIYFLLGLGFDDSAFDPALVDHIRGELAARFDLSWWVFLPVLLLLGMLLTRRPAMLAMLASTALALVVAVLGQGLDREQALNVFWTGYHPQVDDPFVAQLLDRGGVMSMTGTACMMFFVCGMIGALRAGGILQALVDPLTRKVRGRVQLTLVTQVLSALGNAMGSHTFSMLMTTSLLAPMYEKFGLHPTNLSKAVGATSTMICTFIPWNVSGLYITALFSLGVGDYALWACLVYLMSLFTLGFSALGLRVVPAEENMKNRETIL